MAKLLITNKGKKWEILNSWWILTTIFFFGFIGFFYIGITAKQKKWKISGVVYLIVWFLSIFIIQDIDLSSTLLLIGWAISIVHAFLVRKQYLIRREYIIKNKIGEKEKNAKLVRMQEEIRKEYEDEGVAVEQLQESIKKCVEDTKTQSEKNQKIASALDLMNRSGKILNEGEIVENNNVVEKRVDINNCSVEELASLPGVSIVIAKKAVAYRKDHKGFVSAEEFFTVVALEPHFVDQIQNLIICKELIINNTESENDRENNNFDIASNTKKKKGRVLDF